MQQQGEAPASLAIGTQVSAKYKGAFCEAEVRSVVKQVKCRVTFKHGLGSTTLSDEYVKSESPLQMGSIVLAKHPDKQEFLEATVNKIQDQSQYTVVFDDGDITTLRRNALCMKSGKHYNASESLDNLPLTHPEHFSTPVGGRRKRGLLASANMNDSDAEYDSSSDLEDSSISTTYLANVGRVVCIENSDKKSKSKETFFPALVVAPGASEAVRIDTKEDLLVRSFKDGKFYTVAKKDTTRFHRDAIKKVENHHLKTAMERAINYIEKDELPPHWDRETLFKMGDESTTESSESESLEDEEDEESPEEKDRLVAELYKHMEERGEPINRTPSIAGKDVDLYKLFKIVYKLGGHSRVSNNNLWRQVGGKLGFETTWCINQVRVHYQRYLKSFEDLYRQLGCTMKNHSSGGAGRKVANIGSSRAVIRGKHRSGGSKGGDSNADNESDKSSVSSQDEIQDKVTASSSSSNSSSSECKLKKSSVTESDQPIPPTTVSKSKEETTPGRKSKAEKHGKTFSRQSSSSSTKKEDILGVAESTSTPAAAAPTAPAASSNKKGRSFAQDREEAKMTTRPRRDSTSSLAAAMQVEAQKDNIGEESRGPVVRVDRDKETENEAGKLQAKSPNSKSPIKEEPPSLKDEPVLAVATPANSKKQQQHHRDQGSSPGPSDRLAEPVEKRVVEKREPPNSGRGGKKNRGGFKKKLNDVGDGSEEKQHLAPHIEVQLGDKVRIFYKQNMIYEAKVIKVEQKANEKYPRYLVHYQGWNSRYDEYVRRSRIADNLSWSKERVKGDNKAAVTEAVVNEPTPAKKGKDSKAETPPGPAEKSSTRSKGKLAAAASASKPEPAPAPVVSKPEVLPKAGSRTESPATLKRQTSRSSIKKESESDDESDDVRKSARLQPTVKPTVESGRRSGRKRHPKDESENEDVDMEKDFDKSEVSSGSGGVSPPKAKRGRKVFSTPSKKIEEGSSNEEKTTSVVPEEKSLSTTPTRASRNTPSRERAATRQQSSSSNSSTKSVKDEGTNAISNASRGTRKSKTKSDEDEGEDPYAFKEPEPFDEVKFDAPRAKVQTPKKPKESSDSADNNKPASSSNAPALAITSPTANGGDKKKVQTRLKRESDSTDSSSDENVKGRTRRGLKPAAASATVVASNQVTSEEPNILETKSSVASKDDIKKESVPEDMIEQGREVETCKLAKEVSKEETDLTSVKTEPEKVKEEVKTSKVESEAKESEGDGEEGNSLLNMTKKQRELFPFLSAIRTTSVAEMSHRTTSKVSTNTSSAALVTASITETTVVASAVLSAPSTESPSSSESTSGLKANSRSQSPVTDHTGNSNKSYSRQKASKKRKTPRKPSSSELVGSESDSENVSDEQQDLNKLESAKEPKSASVTVVGSSGSKRAEKKSRDESNKNDEEPLKKKCKIMKEDVVDDMDLECGETIPGSPVHLPEPVAMLPSASKLSKPVSSSLEMPFASVPASVDGPKSSESSSSTNIRKEEDSQATNPTSVPTTSAKESIIPSKAAKAPHLSQSRKAGYSDEETPECSSASQSPSAVRNEEGSKSPADSSEVDMESLSGRKEAESEDSRLGEADTGRGRGIGGYKRKAPSSPAQTSKRKRRPREASLRGGGRGGGRGRYARFGGAASSKQGAEDETDESEDPKDPTIANITNLSNDELNSLSQRPPRAARYNFFVDLESTVTSQERISKLMRSIEDVRKTYGNLKNDLAAVDRRRKKIKRKEKSEKEAASTPASSSAAENATKTASEINKEEKESWGRSPSLILKRPRKQQSQPARDLHQHLQLLGYLRKRGSLDGL